MHLFKFDYKSSSSTKTQMKFYSPGGKRCLRATVPANIKVRVETQTETGIQLCSVWWVEQETGPRASPTHNQVLLTQTPSPVQEQHRPIAHTGQVSWQQSSRPITFPCLHSQSRLISHVRAIPLDVASAMCVFNYNSLRIFLDNIFLGFFPCSVVRAFAE